MGACSALDCNGNDRKGHRLYRFPRNPERQQIWVTNCRRKNWIPTNNSCLCQFHFEKSQFDLHRADGKVKLKPNAVPTIFPAPETVREPKKARPMMKRREKLKVKLPLKTQKQPFEILEKVEGLSPVRKSGRKRKSTFKITESDTRKKSSTKHKKNSESSPNSTMELPESDQELPSSTTSFDTEKFGIVEIFMDEDALAQRVNNCENCEELTIENEKLKKENKGLKMENTKLTRELSSLRKEFKFCELALKHLLDETQQRKLKLIVKTVEHEWEEEDNIS